MTNLFLLCFICASQILTSCTDNKKTTTNKDSFIVSATLGGSYTKDTTEIFFIVGKLYNNSSDTLSYLSMTCSWDESWKLSSPNLEIQKNLCFSNVPMLVQLAPHESILNYLPVRLLKHYNEIKDEKFLVGYNLVKANPDDFKEPKLTSQEAIDSFAKKSSLNFQNQIASLQETKNLFWSDTIQLNQIFRFNTIKKEN